MKHATPHCSLCGHRPPHAGCPRCEIRLAADRGDVPAVDPVFERGIHAARVARAEREARWATAVAARGHVTVSLVGCGKRKHREARPARLLYTGPLFKAGLPHAVQTSDETFILSARHHLVELDQVLEPYDERLPCRAEDLALWGKHVECSLRLLFLSVPLRLIVYAGAAYADPVRRAASMPWTFEEPLRGLGVGHRLQWFRAERARSRQLPLPLVAA